VPPARGGISTLMALIIRLDVDRDDQNLSDAVTIGQGVAVKPPGDSPCQSSVRLKFALILIHTAALAQCSHFLKVVRNHFNGFLCLVTLQITGLKPRCE
jgi:hypothetical protein